MLFVLSVIGVTCGAKHMCVADVSEECRHTRGKGRKKRRQSVQEAGEAGRGGSRCEMCRGVNGTSVTCCALARHIPVSQEGQADSGVL